MIVNLNSFDLAEVLLLAERVSSVREAVKSNKEIVLSSSSFEGLYIGFMGEIAVCRAFGIEHPHTLKKGGDGGSEFVYNGRTIQVKCRAHTTDKEDLIFKTRDDFSADVTVMTKMASPTTVKILGCISKTKFLRDSIEKNFGKMPHNNWYVPQSMLSDVSVLMPEMEAA